MIFGTNDNCDKPFLLVSCDDHDFELLPISWLNLLPGGDHNSSNLLLLLLHIWLWYMYMQIILFVFLFKMTNTYDISHLFVENDAC